MRIGAQILGFERQLINAMNESQDATQMSALRLATGRRINSASDDPAGIIALSRYQSDLSITVSSMKNVNLASDIVTQVQSSLSQIRDQINIIRDAALEDVGGILEPSERAAKQIQIENAINTIDTISNGRINGKQLLNKITTSVVGTTDETTVSTLNPAQVNDLQVNSIDANTSVVLSGNVTAASEAELTYQGATGGTVHSTATFSVTGGLGSANISITEGESLIVVRDRVNLDTPTTGVTASLSGDNLVFKSNETGAGAHIEVQAISVDQTIDISGVNPLQVISFEVDAINANSSVTLEGRVKDRAERGTLSYDSDNGVVKEDATFTLTGNLGSASFTVTEFENITGVRDRINLETENTGVSASISGDDIIFEGDYGSSQYVYVEETSGTFDVSGGSASGAGRVDYGKNAKTEINGSDYFGDGNLYSDFTIGPGTFTFEFAPEYEQTYDDITITSTDGIFNITGGNGDGTADGNDTQATINGQNLTAVGDEFTFSAGPGNFTLEFVNGFSGTFDPITVGRTVTDVVRVDGDDTEIGFALYGDTVTSKLNIKGVTSAGLGGITGSLSDLVTGGEKGGLDGNAADAVLIADEALAELSLIEAEVNAFLDVTLASAAVHNSSKQERLETSIAEINHVDVAVEEALLSRNFMLADNAQAAMSLVHQQRQSMMSALFRNLSLA